MYFTYIKTTERECYIMENSLKRRRLNKFIGNTPNVEMKSLNDNKIYGKLEGYNLFGSAKDRAALYILTKLLDDGVITQDTEIIESSSGNMGVALSGICGMLGLKVTIVIDKSINRVNEYLITKMGAKVIKVTKPDENNSYLKERLRTVKEYINRHENIYWFNQYENELVPVAYKETLGREIVDEEPNVDYVFCAISSGGCICGVTEAVKEFNPNTKVIAVDVKGSKIFEPNTKEKKHFTGIGSSIQTKNMKRAKFDDYIVINEKDSEDVLNLLVAREQLFLGGSSGCVYAGMMKYINDKHIQNKKIICVFHDRGDRYFESLYQNIM
jgi:2,3-diaminopropionate biosynthesis protein SbnA